jgi:hypothetical protein
MCATSWRVGSEWSSRSFPLASLKSTPLPSTS